MVVFRLAITATIASDVRFSRNQGLKKTGAPVADAPVRSSLVVVAVGPIIAAGFQAAFLEICVQIRTGKDRSFRVSRSALSGLPAPF
jgi:hypothetical protein